MDSKKSKEQKDADKFIADALKGINPSLESAMSAANNLIKTLNKLKNHPSIPPELRSEVEAKDKEAREKMAKAMADLKNATKGAKGK